MGKSGNSYNKFEHLWKKKLRGTQGRIQNKFEGGGQLVVWALKNFQKLVMRVRYIQQFHTLTADRRLSIHVLMGARLALTW